MTLAAGVPEQPLHAGATAVVRVSVATLWTSPIAPRPCDAAVVAVVPDVPGWISGLSEADRQDLVGRTLTQLLLGDRVVVEDIVEEWALVIALDQARSGSDSRGYLGWLPVAHLVEVSALGEPTHLVSSMVTTLRAEQSCATTSTTGVAAVLGTRLEVLGPDERGWVPVRVPAAAAVMWARLEDLATIPSGAVDAAAVLELATRLSSVPYVWGGMSPYGIDCSGLVHLAHRRFGIILPRDADDQASVTEQITSPADVEPGDLCFFQRPNATIHHVGFATTAGHLFHASMSAGRVQHDEISGALAETLIAVHRVVR
jgi:cell wall-associated NlpC family hydrolase